MLFLVVVNQKSKILSAFIYRHVVTNLYNWNTKDYHSFCPKKDKRDKIRPYVTVDHKTSHKGQFTEIEIYGSSESGINRLSIDVWFVRI